jgi:hypothetical protein
VTINQDTRPWQREENEALAIAVFLGLFAALPAGPAAAMFAPEYGVCVGLPVFLVVFITMAGIVYNVQRRRRFTVSKVFLVKRHIAREVIERVLQEKGMPYEVVNGRFQLEDSTLSIEVDEGYIGLSPFWRMATGYGLFTTEEPGSRIKIHPISAENTSMIMALRRRIDDAFAPRGAS